MISSRVRHLHCTASGHNLPYLYRCDLKQSWALAPQVICQRYKRPGAAENQPPSNNQPSSNWKMSTSPPFNEVELDLAPADRVMRPRGVLLMWGTISVDSLEPTAVENRGDRRRRCSRTILYTDLTHRWVQLIIACVRACDHLSFPLSDYCELVFRASRAKRVLQYEKQSLLGNLCRWRKQN